MGLGIQQAIGRKENIEVLTSRTGASVHRRGELRGPTVLTELMDPGRESADSDTAVDRLLKSSGLLVPTDPVSSAG